MSVVVGSATWSCDWHTKFCVLALLPLHFSVSKTGKKSKLSYTYFLRSAIPSTTKGIAILKVTIKRTWVKALCCRNHRIDTSIFSALSKIQWNRSRLASWHAKRPYARMAARLQRRRDEIFETSAGLREPNSSRSHAYDCLVASCCEFLLQNVVSCRTWQKLESATSPSFPVTYRRRHIYVHLPGCKKKIHPVKANAMSRGRVCMEKLCILLRLCFAVATVQGDPTVLFDPTTLQQKDREHVEKVLVHVDSMFRGLWQWVRPSSLCLMISALRCREWRLAKL